MGYVDVDDKLDVVAAPFTESFSVVEGETGKVTQHRGWPATNLDNSVHASPIQVSYFSNGLGQYRIFESTSHHCSVFAK